jgi:hypothetical protein
MKKLNILPQLVDWAKSNYFLKKSCRNLLMLILWELNTTIHNSTIEIREARSSITGTPPSSNKMDQSRYKTSILDKSISA